MCYKVSLNSLPSFGIADINLLLRRINYSLSRIDSLPPDSWKYVHIPLSFSVRDSFSGEKGKGGTISLYLRKDPEGLYLEIRYKVLRGKSPGDVCLRYYLERRESNLIPGSFRYYFLDPYGEGDSLCSKLYYFPDSGEFVPRSLLQEYGVLYSQQRKGHTDRYYFGLSSKTPTQEELRYRKKHYRGKETPFWRRYQELREREEERFIEFVVGKGYAKGVFPPGVEREVSEEFCRHSGRKSPTPGEKVSQRGKQTAKRG